MDDDLKIVVRISVDNLALKYYLPDTSLFIIMTMGDPRQPNIQGVREEQAFHQRGNVLREFCRTGLQGIWLCFTKFYIETEREYVVEMDFFLPADRKIVPLTRRLGYSAKYPSIDRFSEKFGKRHIIRGKNLRIDCDAVYLPIRMAHLFQYP